jgi:hypothetical protein
LINIQRIARRRPNFNWNHFETSRFLENEFSDKDLDSAYYINL